jgi:hypothetical protein
VKDTPIDKFEVWVMEDDKVKPSSTRTGFPHSSTSQFFSRSTRVPLSTATQTQPEFSSSESPFISEEFFQSSTTDDVSPSTTKFTQNPNTQTVPGL